MAKSIYEQLGVDPHKTNVKEIFGKIVSNEYPGAWCNIIAEPWNDDYVVTKHSDGSGSKSVQRLLDFLKHGDPEIFQNDILDALGMNTGDVACAGFTDTYLVTDALAINKANAPKDEIMKQLALGMAKAIELYRQHGITLKFLGGETADLVDQTQNYILDVDVYSRTRWSNLIQGKVVPGDVIYGFSSAGRAVWEEVENSGIMSNGLTLGRKGLLQPSYCEQYPFLSDPKKPFFGRYDAAWPVTGTDMTISQSLLSPTRQWCFVIKKLFDERKCWSPRDLFHGISMNTGGGATKVKNLGQGITYNKTMPAPPPFFRFIQEATNESWENMYTSFNMGVGLDVVVNLQDSPASEEIIRTVAEKTGVACWKLGECTASADGKNHVVLNTDYGTFSY